MVEVDSLWKAYNWLHTDTLKLEHLKQLKTVKIVAWG